MPPAQVTAPSFSDPIQSGGSVLPGNTPVITHTQQSSDLDTASWPQMIMAHSAWSGLFAFSLVVSIMFAIGILYAVLRIGQIRQRENAHYASQPLSSVARRVFGIETATVGDMHETRWRDVLHHVESDIPNNWRLAILEADVMLDDAITQRGYTGEGVGEKMKQVDRSDINSIDDAWEAHKVRNRIAHDGSEFELTQRETKRVIGLYERVFRELGYIS